MLQENPKLGSLRWFQGVRKPDFEPFLPLFWDFCLFLQFYTFKSCYIQFLTSLDHLSAYVYSVCPGKFKFVVSQGVRKSYFEPFLPIFWDFCLFLQFSSMQSCYIWFTVSLEYPSAYVYSCFRKNIQNQGLSGGIRGYKNTILSQFCLFFEIFCLFLQFSTLESCYIWFTISLEYSSAYVYSCCPG